MFDGKGWRWFAALCIVKMTTESSSIPGKSYLLHFLCAVAICICLLPDSYFKRFDSYQPGNVDLISFWSTYQLFANGEDPYDEHRLRELQAEKGLQDEITKFTWNPPWFFIVLAPLFAWTLGKSTVLLLYLNLVLVLVIGQLMLGQRKALRLYVLAPLMLFYPVIQVLYFGQSSLIIALLVALTFYGFRTKNDLLTGICLALITIKPHLVMGYVATLGLFILLERRVAAILTAILMLLALVLLAGDQVPNWYNTVIVGAQSHSPRDLKTATLVTPLRELFAGNRAIGYLIPGSLGVGVLFSVLAGLSLRRNKELALLVSLCISLAFSPYGWVFDSAILLIPMSALIGRGKNKASLIFLIANALLVIYRFQYAYGQESFFFLAALWGLSMALALVVQSRKAGLVAGSPYANANP